MLWFFAGFAAAFLIVGGWMTSVHRRVAAECQARGHQWSVEGTSTYCLRCAKCIRKR